MYRASVASYKNLAVKSHGPPGPPSKSGGPVKVAGRPGPLPPPSVPGRSTSDTRLTLLYMHVTDDP